jgi:hypothetical protein
MPDLHFEVGKDNCPDCPHSILSHPLKGRSPGGWIEQHCWGTKDCKCTNERAA